MLNVLWVFLLAGAWFTVRLPASRSWLRRRPWTGQRRRYRWSSPFWASLCCIWGLMEIATQSGLAKKVSSVVAVLIKPLFPGLKKQEPASGNLHDLSANALGWAMRRRRWAWRHGRATKEK